MIDGRRRVHDGPSPPLLGGGPEDFGPGFRIPWRSPRLSVMCALLLSLWRARSRRRRLARAERGSYLSHFVLNSRCDRVCAAEHAQRDPLNLLERRHGLAEIVERGAGVPEERLRRLNQMHPLPTIREHNDNLIVHTS